MQRRPTAARDRVPGPPSLCMPPPALAQPGTGRAVPALSSMLVHQRVKDLLAQAGHLFVLGLGCGRCLGSLQGADDFNCVAQDAELEVKVPVLCVAALQSQETEFAHRKAKVLELLDVES